MKLNNEDLRRTKAYINGAWAEADSGETFAVTNPVNDEVIAEVPRMGTAETRRAIEAAHEAYPKWRAETAATRSKALRRWADLMMENQEDLALIMTTEQGKPMTESRGEIAYAASFLEWFSEEARRIYGDTIPQHQADKRIVVTKQPVGVSVGITPWNFPSAMITRKVGPALAVGCTIVVKPAEATPLSALALAELAEQAGIPAGVFNLVTGDVEDAPQIGDEMTSNSLVRKLSFTGSTKVGKMLMEKCAATVKKVSLELGGNAPFIVFDDADLEEAIQGAMICKYRNGGQTCVCANRILVQDSIYHEFTEMLVDTVKQMKVGPGTEEGVKLGPLINQAAIDKVERHIKDALSKGAKVAYGGQQHELGGTFFQPTVLTEVDMSMQISNEENFGPVAGLLRFSTEEEAIKIANDTPAGLASYFYTRDISRVWRVAEGLEYGMVGINTGLISTTVAPFGGMKESGLGREGSKYGVDDWLEIKYMCMGI